MKNKLELAQELYAENEHISGSFLQRKLKISYAEALDILDQLREPDPRKLELNKWLDHLTRVLEEGIPL